MRDLDVAVWLTIVGLVAVSCLLGGALVGLLVRRRRRD